jgi:hypothetical protein
MRSLSNDCPDFRLTVGSAAAASERAQGHGSTWTSPIGNGKYSNSLNNGRPSRQCCAPLPAQLSQLGGKGEQYQHRPSERAARGLAAPCCGRRLTESPARCEFVELSLGTRGGLRSPLFRGRANQSPSRGSRSGWGFGASQGSVLAEGTEHKHQHPFLAGSSSARGFTAADFLVRSDARHLPIAEVPVSSAPLAPAWSRPAARRNCH